MHPFDQVNYTFFSAKDLKSAPVQIQDCWKFENLNTTEVRDLIVKECVEALIHHFALQCGSIGFPELVIPAQMMVERFKKNTNVRKQPQQLLDLFRRNEDEVAVARSQIREKSLRDPSKILQQFTIEKSQLPLAKESAKLKAAAK